MADDYSAFEVIEQPPAADPYAGFEVVEDAEDRRLAAEERRERDLARRSGGDIGELGYIQDTANRTGRAAVRGTGLIRRGLSETARSIAEPIFRAIGGDEMVERQRANARAIQRANRPAGTADISQDERFRRAVSSIRTDPSRDDTATAAVAEFAGAIAPVLATGPVAPFTAGLQMGGGSLESSEAAGLSPEETRRRFYLSGGVGTGLGFLPIPGINRAGVAIDSATSGLRSEIQRQLLRRGVRAGFGGVSGAGVNLAGDVALQLAENKSLDLSTLDAERLRQNAVAGFGAGAGLGLASGGGRRPSITRTVTPEARLELASEPVPVLELQGPPPPARASAEMIDEWLSRQEQLRQSPEGAQLLAQQLDEEAALAANARDVRNRQVLEVVRAEEAAVPPAIESPAEQSARVFDEAARQDAALRQSPEGLQLLAQQLGEEQAIARERALEGVRAQQIAEQETAAAQAAAGRRIEANQFGAQREARERGQIITEREAQAQAAAEARRQAANEFAAQREGVAVEPPARVELTPGPGQLELDIGDTTSAPPAGQPRPITRRGRSGSVSPELLLDPRTRSVLGAGLGGAYGITQGDTPEERARNALLYALGGGAVALAPEAIRRIRPPSRSRTAGGPSAPPFEGVVEPLGRRYLTLEGVGEPVEQFQVRMPGDERGVTMTRADLEAQGIPVPVDSPQIGALGEANAPEARNIEQDNLGQRPGVDEGGVPTQAGRGDSAGQGEEVPPQEPVAPTGGPAKDPYERPGAIENTLGIFNTAIKNISPEIYREVQRYELAAFKPASDGKRAIKAFLDPTKKLLSKPEYDQLGIQLQNGRFDQARAIIEARAVENPQLAAQSLEALGGAEAAFAKALEDARTVGIETGNGLENYWARKVKTATKDEFMEAIGRSNPGPVDDALRAREESLGRRLTEDEEEAVIGQALRGAFSGVRGGVPSHFKARKINDISDLAKYYERWDKSGLDYFDSIYRSIAEKQFFGPDAETGSIGGQLGEVAAKLYREGKLGAKKQSELKNLLQVRFGPGKRGGMKPLSTLRNLVTLSYLGSPIDTITQLGDPIVSASTNGVWNSLKAAASKNRLTLDDFGVNRIGQEFQNEAGLQKTIHNVFNLTGMEKVVGKLQENNLNAALNDFEGAARAAPGSRRFERMRRELEPVFGDEFPQLVEDLRDGTLSDNVKLAAFNRLTESQPITLSEMPISYLRAPNGRILWALKTYTAKQFDLYRRRVTGDIRLGVQELRAGNVKNGASLIRDGLQKGAALTVALAAAGAAPDAIKDTLLGRPIDPDEYVVNNLLRLLGINRYTTYKFRDEGLRSAVMTTAAPPFGIVDSLSKDIVAAARGKLHGPQDVESLQYVPLAGDILYWNVGKGAEKTRKREQKKASEGSADSLRRQIRKDIRDRREELLR